MRTRLMQYFGLLFVALLLMSSTPVATVQAQEGPDTLFIPYMRQSSATPSNVSEVAEEEIEESEAVARAREFFTTRESVKVVEVIAILRPLEVADEPVGVLSDPGNPNSLLLPPGINTVQELPRCDSTADDPTTPEDEVQLEYDYLVKEGLYDRPVKWQYLTCIAGSDNKPTKEVSEGTIIGPDPYDVHPDSPKNKPQGNNGSDAPVSVAAINANNTHSWAQWDTIVNGSDGWSAFSADLAWSPPSLTGSQTWDNSGVFARIVVGYNANDTECSGGLEKIQLGVAKGKWNAGEPKIDGSAEIVRLYNVSGHGCLADDDINIYIVEY